MPSDKIDDLDLTINPGDRVNRLRAWFDAVVELPLEQRDVWLATHVADAAERDALQCLLAADNDSGFLDTPVVEYSARLAAVEIKPEGLIGREIAGFRIKRALGQGGMAAVFLGERIDRDFTQRVAIKLLRRGLYSELEQRLFLRERQVLAALEHPNIARLIDGGVTDAGIPYLVLEYVDGMPITHYADAHRLDVPQRLALFLAVCRAVEAAHRNLIVHRDIKPSNILVSESGEVKLLDFGIAKLIEEDTENPTGTLGIFTPEYAAPEQVHGGSITTATDVYGLGVLLYEVLLGLKPDLTTANAGDPRRPSARVSGIAAMNVQARTYSPEQLRRRLRGDLDNILLKALDPEPGRRYTSAGTFADDVERHLHGRPVIAHPPTRWYKTKKFIQRHRRGVTVTAILLLTIVASLGLALWQTHVAQREAQRASAVRDFVERIFEPIRDGIAEGKQPSLSELITRGVERIDKTVDLGTAERVDLLLMFARLYDYLNDRPRMQALTDRAGELADTGLGRNDPRALEASVERGIVALRREDYAHAEVLLDEAERRFRKNGTAGEIWIRLLDGQGQLVADRGNNPDRSLNYQREALSARIAWFGAGSEEVADGYRNLAFGLEGIGRFSEAADADQLAYDKRLGLHGAESATTASALAALGQDELMAGAIRNANSHLQKAVSTFEKLGGRPIVAHVQWSQSLCLAQLVDAAPKASSACASAVKLAELSDGVDSASVGRALRLQGDQLLQSSELDAAKRALERSQSLLAIANRPNWSGRTEIALGELALIEGSPGQAASSLANGTEHVGSSYPRYLHAYARALKALACFELPTAPSCAADMLIQAKTALKDDPYQWNPLLLPAQIAVARVDLAQSRTAAAIARLDSAIAHAKDEIDPHAPRLIEARLWLVTAYLANADCKSAHDAMDALRTVPAGVLDQAVMREARTQARRNTPCGAFDQSPSN